VEVAGINPQDQTSPPSSWSPHASICYRFATVSNRKRLERTVKNSKNKNAPTGGNPLGRSIIICSDITSAASQKIYATGLYGFQDHCLAKRG
jgi:hypothetical protein